MKALIATLNSKYIHTSISIRYIKHYFYANYSRNYNNIDVDIFESTINNNLETITMEIINGNYDVVGFSCYIWNIEHIEKIIDNIKKIKPEIKIVMGGPEVSFASYDYMSKNNNIDFVVIGEGEEKFSKLIIAMEKKSGYDELSGIVYRENGDIISNNEDLIYMDMDKIPFPYENFEGLENKILYYESSRGCPFGCRYCLSERERKLRFRSLDMVKNDLMKFIKNNVLQVKFVDRTFNADKKHAMEIIKFITENDNGYTNFHFEITASLLDDEMISYFKNIRPELIQFEIGVQSTNEKTLESINRRISFKKIKEMCLKIKENNNIHMHLDLIAGLPYENLESFIRSMNDLFNIEPEKVQLGFLKVLRGSTIYDLADFYGIKYRTYPPYEVLKTNWISYEELSELKMVEEIIDYYYNSMKFKNSLKYIKKYLKIDYGNLFFEIKKYWDQFEHFQKKNSPEKLYEILYEFSKYKNIENIDFLKELLRFDYLSFYRKKSGEFFKVPYSRELRETSYEFLNDPENIEKYLPKYIGKSSKNIMKQVHFEPFSFDIIDVIEKKYDKIVTKDTIVLFDYSSNNKIFEKKKYYKIF